MIRRAESFDAFVDTGGLDAGGGFVREVSVGGTPPALAFDRLERTLDLARFDLTPAVFQRASSRALSAEEAFAQDMHPGDPAGAANYTYGPVLPGAASDDIIHPVDQGNSNACGTASLSMIMDYLGVPRSQAQIDNEVRRTEFGATPSPLIDYARSQGLNAEGYNNGTWEEMKSFVERGIPVQALYNTKASNMPADGHFVSVVGFRVDERTGEEQILFRNSANGGAVDVMGRAEFENKWGNHFGYNNFFIAYAPGNVDLPGGRWDGIEALDDLATGLSNVSNNVDRVIDADNAGDVVHGLVGLPGSVQQVLGGAGGFLVQSAGNWLVEEAGSVPVLGAVTRPVGHILGGLGAGFAEYWNGIGNAWDDLGGAFGSLFRGDLAGFGTGLWDATKDYFGGMWDAGASVVKGVVDAGKDVVNTVVDGAKAVGNAIADGAKAVADFFGF